MQRRIERNFVQQIVRNEQYRTPTIEHPDFLMIDRPDSPLRQNVDNSLHRYGFFQLYSKEYNKKKKQKTTVEFLQFIFYFSFGLKINLTFKLSS